MADNDLCVGGDGGPLIVLQAAAVPLWQGATDFEHSLMNGGNVETDYDILCNSSGTEEIGIITHYNRDMLVLWDSELGATMLPPHLLQLSPDVLVLTRCYHPDALPDLLSSIVETIQQGQPHRSFLFNVQDTMLRLQVGADGSEPSDAYGYLDIPVSPGKKRCDVYLDSLREEIVIIALEAGHKDVVQILKRAGTRK